MWACVGAALAGCSFDGSGLSGGGQRPDADLLAPDADPLAPDASIDGGGGACIPGCLDDLTLRACAPDGTATDTPCALGCEPEPAPHCAQVVPSSGVDPAWLEGVDHVLTVADGETWVFDTTNGTVRECGAAATHGPVVGLENGINFQTVTAGGALALGVWALDELKIEGGGTLRVIGARGGALLIRGEARIEGMLDASGGVRACSYADACSSLGGDRSCAGPGGGAGGEHDQAGEGDGGGAGGTSGGVGVDETGGGGGGFAGKGGKGGGGEEGSAGGVAYGTTTLVPLLGGSGGGGGGENTGNAGVGGGGGGALQITALGRLRVREAGVIRAAGGGGAPGTDATQAGGGGGGSGGGIVLEAPEIEIAAAVAANGGGGGGGGAALAAGGADGGNSATPAAGGGGGVQGYAGGAGGAGAATAPGKDGKPDTPADGSSGGGGGVGRIVFRALPGGLDTGAATVSPPAVSAALGIR